MKQALLINRYAEIKYGMVNAKVAEIMGQIKKPNKNDDKLVLSPNDSALVVDVKLADDGTLRTYLLDEIEPVRIYPASNSVLVISIYKRLFPLLVRSFIQMGWFKRVITLLAIKYNKKYFYKWLSHILFLSQSLLKDENYSQSVKEIRRVLKDKIDESLRDAVSLFFEDDSAYRYRLQDILMLYDRNNQIEYEIDRLVKILAVRELNGTNRGSMVERLMQLHKFVKLLFLISPKTKKFIKSILDDINLNEIAFSKEDIYWTNKVPIYNYRGMSLEERKQENIKNYGKA